MNYTIKMFLKFGEYQNIKDLYENGTIYLNTIQYFRDIEDKELRGDSYEGASEIINSLPGTFKIPGIEREFNYQKMHIKKAYETILGNIYSLYCVSSHGFPNPLDFEVDKRNFRFGTHCLMIKDNAYFFDKIKSELTKQDYKYSHGFIDYYDKQKTTNLKLSLFQKPNEFEYQKEFRFYVENDKLKPIKIQIGSLENYAEIYTAETMSELKLEMKN